MGVKMSATASRTAMAIGALVAGAVMASGATAAGPKTRQGANPAKRVCKMTMPTGSRLVERVCKTKEEWDYNERKAQDSLFQNQIDGAIRPVPDDRAPGIDRKPGGANG
jgi:hypothetical protein